MEYWDNVLLVASVAKDLKMGDCTLDQLEVCFKKARALIPKYNMLQWPSLSHEGMTQLIIQQ